MMRTYQRWIEDVERRIKLRQEVEFNPSFPWWDYYAQGLSPREAESAYNEDQFDVETNANGEAATCSTVSGEAADGSTEEED